jgi:large subunit ribosomal protein L3
MNEEKENIKKDLEVSDTEIVSKQEAAPAEEAPAAEEAAPAEEAPAAEEAAPAEEAPADEEVSESEEVNPYAKFLLGTKIGMTNVFSETGLQFPATVIEAGPCYISQIKTDENDGYNAVQIGFKFDKKANKPKKNHFTKNKCEPMKYSREFRVDTNSQFLLGEKIDVNIFSEGDYVNISGVSKGKGFAGVMKRHGFGGGRASHGKNSVMRKPGSVGAGADPSRIWKGKKMPGRYGGDRVTCKNLEILKIDTENNLLFIKGAIPGANNNLVSIAI